MFHPDHRPLRLSAALASLVLGLALTGCGSDDEPATAADEASVDAGLAAAKKQVAELTAPPTSVGVDKPIDTSAVEGKTVVYLECAIVNCKIHADALEEAFEPLGIKLQTVNSGLSPETFKEALDTALSLHPDGVISDAIPASIAQAPIDKMAAEGIKVVTIVGPDLKLSDGVANVMGATYMHRQGETLANWAIVDSEGKADVVYVNDTTLAFSPFASKGLTDTFTANCPACTVDELGTNSGEIGSALPDKISSYLQAHPDVKYVVAEYSALLTGLPAALSTAGITGIKTIGASPTQINQQYMLDGQETAGIFNSNAAMSYYAADTVARLMSGEQPLPVAEDPPNMQLMDASGVTWDPEDADYTWIDGWQDQFTQAWLG